MQAQPRIDTHCLRMAHLICLVFASMFTAFSIGLGGLVASVNLARPERLGYMLCTVAASVSLWVVWWMLRQARNPKPPPLTPTPRR